MELSELVAHLDGLEGIGSLPEHHRLDVLNGVAQRYGWRAAAILRRQVWKLRRAVPLTIEAHPAYLGPMTPPGTIKWPKATPPRPMTIPVLRNHSRPRNVRGRTRRAPVRCRAHGPPGRPRPAEDDEPSRVAGRWS